MTLQNDFNQKIKPAFQKELHLSNPMAVPKLVKIVVNVGLGEALVDRKVIDKVSTQLAVITGQKPQVTKAKRSIASFKLRAGEAIGLKVTLRGKRMYAFFNKFVSIALPRVRDFRGVSLKSFDGRGNLNLGLAEQTIFPDLDYALVDKTRGLGVTIVTTAKSDNDAQSLLTKLGIPFEKGTK